MAQTRESEAKEEEEQEAARVPGRARRGGAPLVKKGKTKFHDALSDLGLDIEVNEEEEEDDNMEGYVKGTSVNEMRNLRFKSICSEIIDVLNCLLTCPLCRAYFFWVET